MSGKFNLQNRCLTKGDIAEFLNISERQASRLMQTMKTIRTGRAQRRVLRCDFQDWLLAHRDVPFEESAMFRDVRSRETGRGQAKRLPSSGPIGSVAEAAAKLRAKSKK